MDKEEAIKILKNFHDKSALFSVRTALETLHPELKESEDEKIRKALICHISKISTEIPVGALHRINGVDIPDILAWLENQIENNKPLYIRFGDVPKDEKSKIYNGEIEIGTEKGVSVYPAFEDLEGNIVLGLSLPITKTSLYTQQHLLEYDTRPCYLVSGDYIGKGTDGEPLLKNVKIIREIKNFRVKQGEQKPENKVEPKFKVGDWVVLNGVNGNPVQITSFEEDKGVGVKVWFSNGTGTYVDFLKGYHKWTIQDANGGDVLIDKSDSRECPFIFKETKPSNIKTDMLNPLTVLGYCGIGGAGFTKGSGWGDTANCTYYPATKAQRNALLKAMADAGYTFDFEKKELKKIEQKPAWSEEDEEYLRRAIKATKEVYPITSDWLKSIKQRIKL